jgi:hypothetical protein
MGHAQGEGRMSLTSIEDAHRMAFAEKKRKQGGDVMGTLTLRDYFAAKAMQAMLDQKDAHDGREYKSAAWMAYQMADAMMKARDE